MSDDADAALDHDGEWHGRWRDWFIASQFEHRDDLLRAAKLWRRKGDRKRMLRLARWAIRQHFRAMRALMRPRPWRGLGRVT